MDMDVAIVGAGPVGMLLACELGLAGVRAVAFERDAEPPELPKANGLVGQIVRVLGYRGLLDDAPGLRSFPTPQFQFGPLALELGMLAPSPLHVLPVQQRQLQSVLAAKAVEHGAEVLRGYEVVSLSDGPEHVELTTTGPGGEERHTARFVVGCDGAHSFVRKNAGIGFPGITSSRIARIARVVLPASAVTVADGGVEIPGAGRFQTFVPNITGTGSFSIAPAAVLDPAAAPDEYIISISEELLPDGSEDPTLEGLQLSLKRVIGAELPLTSAQGLRTTVGNSRQAEQYRAGRLFLAGDAAHIFSAGGSALNAGMLDAFNLGWKLGAALQGLAAPGLLASYHAERHPAGARTLMQTRAQSALSGSDAKAEALRQLLAELLQYREPLRHLADTMEGSDIRYSMPGQHSPLAGRWAPDVLSAGPSFNALEAVLRKGRPALLDFTPNSLLAEAAGAWRGRVDMVHSVPGGAAVEGASAGMLIRPDGYIAWAGDDAGTHLGLHEALGTWFGPA